VLFWEILYFLALGLAVSAASKVAGSLLVFCYLVVTPSAALLLSRRMSLVLAASVLMAVGSTLVGLCLSFARDLPTNQTVAVTACGLFALSLVVRAVIRLLSRPHFMDVCR
jgi:ABC-type Mn2+/Zn2+ transport system permease subunit